MPILNAKQISVHLESIPLWAKRGKNILRTFKFDDFLDAVSFVNRIAPKAQKMNHHPDIDIRYDKVTLNLTTHDESGLTEKDFTLARQCEEVFSKFFS